MGRRILEATVAMALTLSACSPQPTPQPEKAFSCEAARDAAGRLDFFLGPEGVAKWFGSVVQNCHDQAPPEARHDDPDGTQRVVVKTSAGEQVAFTEKFVSLPPEATEDTRSLVGGSRLNLGAASLSEMIAVGAEVSSPAGSTKGVVTYHMGFRHFENAKVTYPPRIWATDWFKEQAPQAVWHVIPHQTPQGVYVERYVAQKFDSTGSHLEEEPTDVGSVRGKIALEFRDLLGAAPDKALPALPVPQIP